jgi:hypothetical protein
MDPELEAMLIQTIKVRSPTAYTSGGNETLDTARDVAAYVEIKTRESGIAGGTQKDLFHFVVTKESITEDDRVWLPGADSTNTNLGKTPMGVKTYFNPETGVVDHYEFEL